MNNQDHQHYIKINLPGGIVSPGDLLTILEIAEEAGVKQVRFGNRQQLLFYAPKSALADIESSFMCDEIEYEIDQDIYPNILSSYVTEEILSLSSWLREGVYKDILNGFNYQPKLKINIVDRHQNLIPFFTGHLNYISSETSNYWYLHIRFPKGNTMYSWPKLIYSEDIPLLSAILEEKILTQPEWQQQKENEYGEKLVEFVSQENKFVSQDYHSPLKHTDFQLPYYEGFNRYGDQKLWIGVYRRKEEFPISFLKEVCEICATTRVGQLYTTAWKSLVVKNIKTDDRKYWSQLLDLYRINIRHAANELNWQLEDLCEEALALKIDLVKHFEEADLRTYRLCFAIKTKPNTGLFGSVIIKKANIQDGQQQELYDVFHSKNFNPNNKEYIVFGSKLTRNDLAQNLISLSNYYYSIQENLTLPDDTSDKTTQDLAHRMTVHQCKHCKTIYHPEFGDSINQIIKGTPFEDLKDYYCPICDAPKEEFMLTELPSI